MLILCGFILTILFLGLAITPYLMIVMGDTAHKRKGWVYLIILAIVFAVGGNFLLKLIR